MNTYLFAMLTTFGISSLAHADKTIEEKTTEVGHDLKRGAKKAGNRISEATCTGSDLKCGAKKAGNRVEEAADKAKDKIDEKTN